MVLKWQEAAFPLAMVLVLVICKYVPGFDGMPFGRLAGIVSFSYAIFLSLRLVQGEQAVVLDGWSELRPSAVELFGGIAATAFAVLLLVAVAFMGGGASAVQVAAAFVLSLAFAVCAAGIAVTALIVKVRWNWQTLEHHNGFGKRTAIAWADVTGVKTHWRGITIFDRDSNRISFSPYHSGAAELMEEALRRIERNTAPPQNRTWPLMG